MPQDTQIPVNITAVQITPLGGDTAMISQQFEMQFDFVNDPNADPPASCRCCEFRQYVKGYVQVKRGDNWYNVNLPWLSDDFWQEDTNTAGDFYGHRVGYDNAPPWDSYFPDRLTGCQYRGKDWPQAGNLQLGDIVNAQIEFSFEVWDYCQDPPLRKFEQYWVLSWDHILIEE